MDGQGNAKWNPERYLERIHMKEPVRLDLEYLNQLIERHLIYIPFENMDLITGRADISQDLGYHTYPCFCRVQEGREESEDILHRGNIVHLDGKVLFCDVGYGNSMSRGAIELKEHILQRHGADTFWVKRYNDYWFDIFRQPQDMIHEDGTVAVGRPVRELRVCIAPMEEQDFIPLNAITSSPDSPFRKEVMVGRLTENGALAVNQEMVFSRVVGNRKERKKLCGDRELWRVLKDEFGIIL